MNLPLPCTHTMILRPYLKNRVTYLKWEVDEQVYSAIGQRSRGTPRIALKCWRAAQDGQGQRGHELCLDHLHSTLGMEGIDWLGLTIDERKYLSIVHQHNNLIRLNVIATCMGQSSRSISTNVEPYLIRIGLLSKDSKTGCRVLTEKGLKHIQKSCGVNYPMKEDFIPDFVSIPTLCSLMGISRSRYYQLLTGSFILPPIYSLENKRAYFTRELAERNLLL